MDVQYYPPHSPPDPSAALEEHLRRAYPAPDSRGSARLQEVLRRLKEKANPQDARLT